MSNKNKTVAVIAMGSVFLVLATLGLIYNSEDEFEKGKTVRLPAEFRLGNPLQGLKDFFSSKDSLFSGAPGREGAELIHTRVQKDGFDVEITRIEEQQIKKSPALMALSPESLWETRIYSFTLRAADDCIPEEMARFPRRHVFLNDREGRKIEPLEIPQLENYAKVVYKKKICGSGSAPVYVQYYAAYPRKKLPVSFSLQDMKGGPAASRSAG